MPQRTTVTTIGESIVIKGELSADEDLVIQGRIEGRITLNQNALTVSEHGIVEATVAANTVVVAGKVRGDIKAAEKVDLRDTCSVEGDICAPRAAIALGAYFRGGIDMRQPQGGEPAAARAAGNADDVVGQTPPKGRSAGPGLISPLRAPSVPTPVPGGRSERLSSGSEGASSNGRIE